MAHGFNSLIKFLGSKTPMNSKFNQCLNLKAVNITVLRIIGPRPFSAVVTIKIKAAKPI
jgi:hypothetical protein